MPSKCSNCVNSFAQKSLQLPQSGSLYASNSLQKDGRILVVNKDNVISKIQPDIVQSMDNFIAIKGMNNPFRVIVGNMPGAIEGMKVTTDSEI